MHGPTMNPGTKSPDAGAFACRIGRRRVGGRWYYWYHRYCRETTPPGWQLAPCAFLSLRHSARGSGTRGDLIVQAEVTVPDKLAPEQEEAMRKFAEAMKYRGQADRRRFDRGARFVFPAVPVVPVVPSTAYLSTPDSAHRHRGNRTINFCSMRRTDVKRVRSSSP